MKYMLLHHFFSFLRMFEKRIERSAYPMSDLQRDLNHSSWNFRFLLLKLQVLIRREKVD